MNGHRFGGTWTEIKLDALTGYLGYYNNVLRTQPRADRPFRRWYVDAFAGSGSRTVEITRGGWLDGEPEYSEELELAGSARKALGVTPNFDRLLFIEPHRGRFADLAELKRANPDRTIDCKRGDANEELAKIFSVAPWRPTGKGNWTDRAVVFLDPYGMGVNWSTLELLAATRAVDVWYLFPLEAVNRQLAHDFDRIDVSKQVRLDEIFGTPDWRTDLYRTYVERDIFDVVTERTGRHTDKKQIETYALERFRSIFSYVSPPMPLVNDAERHLFSLLCLANPATEAATKAIKKGVDWVFKQHGPASHHRFGR